MPEFLFIIYSCKQNMEKSNFLYEVVNDRLPNCTCYIMYGEPTLETDYAIIDNKYLAIKCGDFYEHLCEKTITLCKIVNHIFPNIRGMFKCDDDIFPNVLKIREMISQIEKENLLYIGHSTSTEEHLATHHFHKCSNEIYNVGKRIHPAKYACGPLYYLASSCIHILSTKLDDIAEYFYEDLMVGHILNQYDIFPTNYKSYYDEYENRDKGCLQNVNNKYKKLFVKLHGGLGNQLFQVAAADELANRHNMLLVLLYLRDYHLSMNHNNSANEFASTIFSSYASAIYENVNLNDVRRYKQDRCFDYDTYVIRDNVDTLLDGYFQHQLYIPNLAKTVAKYENRELCQQWLEKYPNLETSYFIHVRRGDYQYYSIYDFDKDAYYKKAIEYVLEKTPSAHFFIFSDDPDFCENYAVFLGINKTIVRGSTTLEDFYGMGLCKWGGICANSTYSGWAAQMNRYEEKIVICPKEWIQVDYEYAIPFEYTHSF